MKKLNVLMLAMIISTLTIFSTLAVSETNHWFSVDVEVDNVQVFDGDDIRLGLDRGDMLDIEVRLKNIEDVDDVQVQAAIFGYEHGIIQDNTNVFDLRANTTYIKNLKLDIPTDLDVDNGDYKLRVFIADRNRVTQVAEYELLFEAMRHEIVIDDILLDPSRQVVAGRGLLASVHVDNEGQKDEESVRISVSIPALGLEATEFIDELDRGDAETSEDMFLRIPTCAEPGTYVVRATVSFNDFHDTVTKDSSIRVLESDTCPFNQPEEEGKGEGKTVITVPGSQDVRAGGTGVYPIMISNTGASTKTYTVSVEGVANFGTFRVDPSTVVQVGARKTETAFVYVTASEDASPGQKNFIVSVESDKDQEQIPLKINVQEKEKPAVGTADWEKIRRGLEIGFIVLVILLIILALIIGFNKLKESDENGDEPSGQTYY